MPHHAGGTSLTKHCVVMARFAPELIDGVTCCIQYSRVSEPGDKRNTTQWHGASNILTERRVPAEVDAAFEKELDPIEGSSAAGKSVAGITNLFVDDLFETGGTDMEQRVLARLREVFCRLVQKTGTM